MISCFGFLTSLTLTPRSVLEIAKEEKKKWLGGGGKCVAKHLKPKLSFSKLYSLFPDGG